MMRTHMNRPQQQQRPPLDLDGMSDLDFQMKDRGDPRIDSADLLTHRRGIAPSMALPITGRLPAEHLARFDPRGSSDQCFFGGGNFSGRRFEYTYPTPSDRHLHASIAATATQQPPLPDPLQPPSRPDLLASLPVGQVIKIDSYYTSPPHLAVRCREANAMIAKYYVHNIFELNLGDVFAREWLHIVANPQSPIRDFLRTIRIARKPHYDKEWLCGSGRKILEHPAVDEERRKPTEDERRLYAGNAIKRILKRMYADLERVDIVLGPDVVRVDWNEDMWIKEVTGKTWFSLADAEMVCRQAFDPRIPRIGGASVRNPHQFPS